MEVEVGIWALLSVYLTVAVYMQTPSWIPESGALIGAPPHRQALVPHRGGRKQPERKRKHFMGRDPLPKPRDRPKASLCGGFPPGSM